MPPPTLVMTLLLVASFGLAGQLYHWQQESVRADVHTRRDKGGVLTVLLGDSRRIFSNHFFKKADAYFHSGYYPSIFDAPKEHASSHMAEGTSTTEAHDEAEASTHEQPPLDRLEWFGRFFFPSKHTHLDEGGTHDHDHEHGHGHEPGDQCANLSREILPWLRLSAELDPNRVETYTVSAFWLRTKLGKSAEAEVFLREGLRANPGSYEILFELGRVYHENRKETTRARNVWEMALEKWKLREAGKEKPDIFLLAQIAGQLAQLERAEGNYSKAIYYFELLKRVSPNPSDIEKQIQELREKAGPENRANESKK